jgi:hypothetical protein
MEQKLLKTLNSIVACGDCSKDESGDFEGTRYMVLNEL